uniref:Uncharacterized protein n=1 Tax=Chaetoceros debilis TaxID=122233 RepID=A0A7S3VDR9_9STRA
MESSGISMNGTLEKDKGTALTLGLLRLFNAPRSFSFGNIYSHTQRLLVEYILTDGFSLTKALMVSYLYPYILFLVPFAEIIRQKAGRSSSGTAILLLHYPADFQKVRSSS